MNKPKILLTPKVKTLAEELNGLRAGSESDFAAKTDELIKAVYRLAYTDGYADAMDDNK